jgi:hypothetical protein
MKKSELTSFADIFKAKQAKPTVKAPAYSWQELALKIINELNVPNFKRSSIFKICKEKSVTTIERALNDTRELCKGGESWKYFLKIISSPATEYKPKTYVKNIKHN